MTIRQQAIKRKSAERLVFEHYLRTGRRLRPKEDEGPAEQKFNPYHDPRNGQFTFAPGGSRSLRSDSGRNRSTTTSAPKQQAARVSAPKVPTRPSSIAADDLGALSARYESHGSGDPGTVSSGDNDPGGISYGSYQLSTKKGTADAFATSREAQRWANEFRGLKAGTAQFSAKWRAIAAREREAFQAAQKAYVQRTLYNDTVQRVSKATGYDLNGAGPAVRQVTYSTAVQHGGTGGARVMTEAIRRADQKLKRTDARYKEALVDATYDRRTEIFLVSSKRNKILADEQDKL